MEEEMKISDKASCPSVQRDVDVAPGQECVDEKLLTCLSQLPPELLQSLCLQSIVYLRVWRKNWHSVHTRLLHRHGIFLCATDNRFDLCDMDFTFAERLPKLISEDEEWVEKFYYSDLLVSMEHVDWYFGVFPDRGQYFVCGSIFLYSFFTASSLIFASSRFLTIFPQNHSKYILTTYTYHL